MFNYVDERLREGGVFFAKKAVWHIQEIETVSSDVINFNILLTRAAGCLNAILRAEYLPFRDGASRLSCHAISLKLMEAGFGYQWHVHDEEGSGYIPTHGE